MWLPLQNLIKSKGGEIAVRIQREGDRGKS